MHARVHSRRDLALKPLVDRFLEHTREEDPRLHKLLSHLDTEGIHNLAGVLGRFDRDDVGELDAERRLHARRVLLRLRRPTTHALALLNRVLDYVDLNGNALLEQPELHLFLELARAFESAQSPNDTLSAHELGLLYAFLRASDHDHDGRLSADERHRLHENLRQGNLQLAGAPPHHPHR